ncbi:uncharacterized protein LOC134818006 isoform X2 [Bolinopsis microptera]|uniref:uncharacterized protein LOC134818006 isoform X2 n=1 Tax=Bolinopsis microptera TaxID=2820187 RepID=UPI0030796AA7
MLQVEDSVMQTKAAQCGPLPKKAKVVTQKLDPTMFQRKSRFDQSPAAAGKSAFATGANATPLGKQPTVVLNKYSISSSLTTKKKDPVKAQLIGFKMKEDGTLIAPENSCTVDIKIQRAIMQELAQMLEFKFTIGINKLYKGITRNQKNKKKNHPLKIEEELDIGSLMAYCEEMTHFVRVKKQKYIKLLPNITPYIRAGVNLWAMFHGRGTRRIIRDNWVHWIGPFSPQTMNMDWDFYFQVIRSCYMSCHQRQRSKFRSKFKGIEKYVVANTMWAPNKTVKFEKLVQELKCSFAIKKAVQTLVDWKKVVRYVVGSVKILTMGKGDLVTFDPKLRALLVGIEKFVAPNVGKVNFENMVEFEEKLRQHCVLYGGYDWSEWDLSLRTVIKLYNCCNTSIHRPDPNSSTPDVRVAFSKVFRQGFEELVLPVQECKLGESTIPAMVKREMVKHNRHEEKKASKIAELKKVDEEAKKRLEEELLKLEELKAATEVDITAEEMPSNADMMLKIAGVDVVKREDADIIQVEEADKPKSYSDMEVSEDDEDSFQFEPIYTYCQYIQPLTSDVLYPIPGGSMLDDEIKLRVDNQPTAPGKGYGLALSNAKHSVLFVFYPFARTMRTNHYYDGKHHHRFYSDFRAGGHNLFQLTIKIKRNRFEVFADALCVKTVPAFMNTVGITAAMVTGDTMPFVNFRVRRLNPEVPVLPYLIKTRHQKGVLVTVVRHPQLGLITKIGKISGNIQMFVTHLQDMLATDNLATDNIATDNLATDNLATDNLATGNLATDNLATDNLATDNLATDNLATGNPATDHIATDNLATDNLATGNPATDNLATDNLATDNLATDNIASDNLATDNIATDHIATDNIATDNLATGNLATGNLATFKKPLPNVSVVNQKSVWVTGHHKTTIKTWLKCIGF